MSTTIERCPEVAFGSAYLTHIPYITKRVTSMIFVDSKFDIFFLTETWQTSVISPAFYGATSTTHHYFHVTRPGTGSGSTGGGCGAIISRHILNVKFSCIKISTFEWKEVQFNFQMIKM